MNTQQGPRGDAMEQKSENDNDPSHTDQVRSTVFYGGKE